MFSANDRRKIGFSIVEMLKQHDQQGPKSRRSRGVLREGATSLLPIRDQFCKSGWLAVDLLILSP